MGTLQEIVLDEEFSEAQNEFFQKNCEVFEDVEENQMVHYEIFKSYQAMIENSINLVKEFLGGLFKGFLGFSNYRKGLVGLK